MVDSTSNSEPARYWNALALRYASISEPLVPSPDEMAIYWHAIAPCVLPEAKPTVLVLGATPAFYHLPWPAATNLLAVDRSSKMLQSVWPGAEETRLCAEWTTLQLPAGSRDIVLCDGGLSCLPVEAQLVGLREMLCRVMPVGGIFVVRIYSAESSKLRTEAFPALIEAGEIRNSSELKLYLWLALASPGAGVRLHDVWQFVQDNCRDFASRVKALGWSQGELESMDAYKDCDDVYVFPTSDQLRKIFCQGAGSFEFVSLQQGKARFAQYLPILTLRRC